MYISEPKLIVPNQPLKVALIGSGARSGRHYRTNFGALKPWIEVVAVCDPFKENCDAMASELGVRAYYDIRKLVKDRPMEAAIVVTPVESHHSISVYLSSNGIHNHVETTWCSMLSQARQMIDTARDNNVITRVAENFYRFEIDRFAQTVRDSEYIGPIHRIVSYNDHTGYHNNSRWIAFAKAYPQWVQSVSHSMPTSAFYYSRHRVEGETYRIRLYQFPDGFFVADQMSNLKGLLGRHPRPGYTEWQGERGALIHRSGQSTRAKAKIFDVDGIGENDPASELNGDPQTELRFCSDTQLSPREKEVVPSGGTADEISKVISEFDAENQWIRTYCDTSGGRIEYRNPIRQDFVYDPARPYYACAIMGHIIDFVLAVKGLAKSEFSEDDALMSLMMEMAARESVYNDGKRVALPIEGELEADDVERQRVKEKLGVDPFDVDGMLSLSYPKP